MFHSPDVPSISVADLTEDELARVHVLDVREDDEWAGGHIPGAQHIPLGQLTARVDEVPDDQRVVCVCAVGGRSGRATGFLVAAGKDVVNLDGGMHQWAAAGRPVTTD